MPEKHLHIVAFDVPYPPNYGGVIDVFYKIKALHEKGIHLHLHIIEYPGRDRAPELESYCDTVRYYPRVTGLKSAYSLIPYIVISRRSSSMMDDLLKDDYPILFEGLHSCYYLDDPRLKGRVLIYRESNIEHQYYFNLFKVEHNLYKKAYFLVESIKLYLYQKVLQHADVMLVVSKGDRDYLQKAFIGKEIQYLPSFHANTHVTSAEGQGDYFLYHGNIEVPENEAAASFLIRKVFGHTKHRMIIAGMNPPESIYNLAERYENVEVIPNPNDAQMSSLIRDAQANILVTFQASGLKLKLLNTLYNGRFCIVNNAMLSGTDLEDLCIIGNTPEELISILNEIDNQTFTRQMAEQRESVLQQNFSNIVNADRMIEIIFNR
ncbi:MAG: glycosyltransferase family 1 protein [Lentimicrobiaceae bacterium]